MPAETPSPEVIDLMGDVAELMLAELDDLVAEMDAAEVELSPTAGSDAAVLADTSASNRANAARLLSLFARRDAKMAAIDVPPEALDIARTVARRGMDLDVIFQSYRRGQNVAWRRYMAHATQLVPSGPLLIELLEVASRRMFEYVDHVVANVIAAAQREREEVLGGAIARRAETIRLILDGAAIDTGRAGERLGYDLRQRHTALVLWTPPHGDVQGALESAAAVLARAAGTRPPLTLSVGPSTLWAWLGSSSEPVVDALSDAITQAQNHIRVAVGPTRPGITGFRRSHEAALAIQSLLAGHPGGARVALFRDPRSPHWRPRTLIAQPNSSRQPWVRSRRTRRRRPACAIPCASSSTKPTTRHAPPAGCTLTAIPSCSGWRGRPSSSATSPVNGGWQWNSHWNWRTSSVRGC